MTTDTAGLRQIHARRNTRTGRGSKIPERSTSTRGLPRGRRPMATANPQPRPDVEEATP